MHLRVSQQYGLFGEISNPPALSRTSDPVMYGWQGLSYDAATGNWDNRARQYDQNSGRFMSQDPLGLDGDEVNLYRSRKNNPLLYVDQDGEMAKAASKAAQQCLKMVAKKSIESEIVSDEYERSEACKVRIENQKKKGGSAPEGEKACEEELNKKKKKK